ncbi:hypothetical protein D9M71_587280 [compost metagenome]
MAQVGNRLEVGRLGFQFTLGIAFDHITRHVPAFDRPDYRRADPDHLAGGLGLVPDLTAAHPLFSEHLDVVGAQGVFHGDGVARQAIGLAVVTLFQHELHHVGEQHAALPIQTGKLHWLARFAPACCLADTCGRQ